ncbi:MAG: hypothetical protein JWM59_824 [Verrucomicrobiales bacterium]|nr:hypothetical protein [Verrucomicrobiales bacterium]
MIHSFLTRAVVLSPLLIASTTASLYAEARVGIQFLGGSTAAQLAETETAGTPLTSQSHWNYTDTAITGATENIAGPTAGKLVDNTGAETPITVVWNSTNTWNTTNGVTTPDSKLINGYLDNTGAGASITLSGIPYTAYSVVVYFGSDGNGRTGQVNNETTGVAYSFSTASNFGRGMLPADYKSTTDTGTAYPQANFCVFAGQTAKEVTLSMIRGSNNSGFHAIQIVEGGDTDGDTMPDSYESVNGLNSVVNDAAGDLDQDGLTNIQEYTLGTKPNLADTDGDGLKDGVETRTGIYVNPQDTGSDPLVKDTDKDGIEDGPEVATGAGDPHITNPVNRDTDGDGYTDGDEVAKATDPTQASSNPSATGVAGLIGINFTGGYNGIPSPLGTGTAGVGSFAQTGWNDIDGTAGNGTALKNSTGQTLDAVLNWSSLGTWGVADPATTPADDNAKLMQGYLDTTDTSTTMVEVLNIPYRTYDVVLYVDGDSGDGSRYGEYTVNGVTRKEVRDSANWPVGAGEGEFVEAPSSRSSGNYLVFRNVSGGSLIITAKPTNTAAFRAPLNAVQILSAVDTDNDGMPDQWETDAGLNPASPADAALDKDNDGLTNLLEYQRSTHPTGEDTDGDGLKDGVENGGGTYTSPSQTGSNPLDPDTDGDGRTDGDEVTGNPSSNPNKLDSDDDGYSDAYEVANSLDPSNAQSPASLTDSRRAIGVRFNGSEANALLPTEAAGYFAVRQTHWNNADGSATGTTDLITSPTPGVLVDNKGAATATTIEWAASGVYNTQNGTATPDAKLTNGYLDNTGSGATLTFSGIPYAKYDVVAYFGSDGNDRTGSIFSETANQEFFYRTAANNAAGFGKDGYVETTETVDAGTANPRSNFARFTNQTSPTFLLQVNRGDNNSGFLAVQVVEAAGTPPASSIEVTGITRSPAGAVTVTWVSTPGAQYTVERSADLGATNWTALTTNLPATGTSTSYTDSTLPANTARMFYRIKQN